MTSRLSDCFGASDKERLLKKKCAFQVQFFEALTQRSFLWMFIRLDMPPSRQPSLRIDVVDKQDVLTIDNGKVRDQVLVRCCRLLGPTELDARVNPIKNGFDSADFQIV